MNTAVLARLAAQPWLGQVASYARRWSSTQPELPSLKAALRAVYKRVHPDLFHDHQPARDANTRSFKMLQEYLDAARTGSKVPLPYRFHFFVRSSGGSSSSAGTASTHDGSPAEAPASDPSAGLREVVLTLPPPTRGAPGEAMSGATRKAFGSLLAALGLPSRFASGAHDDAAAADEYSRFVSLRDFLPHAVEAVHQHAAVQSSAQSQLAVLRTALRLGRRLTVGFGEPAASAGPLKQLALLQLLASSLDGLPHDLDLSGLRMTIGGGVNGVDALGTVWLAADGSQAAWSRHLSSVNAAQCRERQQLVAAVKQQEGAVAAALGLAMVYPQQAESRLDPEYRQALERLAAAAAARGPVGGGKFSELPLMLQPHITHQGSSDTSSAGARQPGSSSGSGATGRGSGGWEAGRTGPGGCAADAAAGLLLAPLAVGGEQLYGAVERLGGQVLAALQQRRQREQELAALRTQVERKLMLRRLLRQPGVSDAQYKSCLDRMLAHAQQLSGLLHGQAVRVSEVNALSPDKTVIDVAWNWRM